MSEIEKLKAENTKLLEENKQFQALVKEQSKTIDELQKELDQLAASASNGSVSLEVEHKKERYQIAAKSFRLGDKVYTHNDFLTDSGLVKRVLEVEGQQILISIS